jgi:hypothetical protein
MTGGRMEILYVPADGTDRFQVNDTHLHKPMKGYAQYLAAKWYTRHVVDLNKLICPKDTSTEPITETDYAVRMSGLMSIGRLRNMAPVWLNESVKHISKNIDGEDRNLIKKGWDELYWVPIQKEGFLEQAKQDHKVAQEQCQKDKQQALFDAMKAWESKNGSLDGFDALKVDIISVHEQAARGVSQVESKFHEM